MDLVSLTILSLIEGVTEFLPISSTGHLILASNLLALPNTDFLKTFQIVIQLGAVLAVIHLYWKQIYQNPSLLKKLVFGMTPTIIVGTTLYPILKSVLLESSQIVSISLIIGGILIIFIEHKLKKYERGIRKSTQELQNITNRQAFITGLTQSIAIIPGVSRSGASIFGGMLFGMNRKTATEFSFLLALPTIAAASGFDLIQTAPSFSQKEILYLIAGIMLSFIVALFAIKWLLKYITTHSFVVFGWYRIILGIIFLIIL